MVVDLVFEFTVTLALPGSAAAWSSSPSNLEGVLFWNMELLSTGNWEGLLPSCVTEFSSSPLLVQFVRHWGQFYSVAVRGLRLRGSLLASEHFRLQTAHG